jgi:hypothetical protein
MEAALGGLAGWGFFGLGVKSYLGIREVLRVVVEPTPLEPFDIHLARDDHFAV